MVHAFSNGRCLPLSTFAPLGQMSDILPCLPDGGGVLFWAAFRLRHTVHVLLQHP